MKKSICVAIVFAVVGFFSTWIWASAAKRLSLSQLVSYSDRVVVARLDAPGTSAWGPKRMRIYTTFTFEVEEDVAGSGPNQVTIVQPGGRVGRLAQKTEGYPGFKGGDRLLLFLVHKQTSYRVVGLSQGVFAFHNQGGRVFVAQRIEGLSFVDDAGHPLLFESTEALSKIKTLFAAKTRVSK